MEICDICAGPIEPKGTWTGGNNASPVVENGRCCDSCCEKFVMPMRIALRIAGINGLWNAGGEADE